MPVLLVSQAAAEYALLTARQTFAVVRAFATKAVVAVANLVSTPRGALIAAVLVFCLLLSLGRKRRW